MNIENKAELYYGDYLVAEANVIDVVFEEYPYSYPLIKSEYGIGYFQIYHINDLWVLPPLNCCLKLVIRRPDNSIVLYDSVHLLPAEKTTKEILKYNDKIDFRFHVDKNTKIINL